MLAEQDATVRNIKRKAAYVDRVQIHDGRPLFAWIELSLTELCNRVCPFCPRKDPEAYPNQPLHMSLALARKIAGELRDLHYQGTVVLCGFGEPLLHPDIVEIARWFHDVRCEIVTNGDRLTPALIRELTDAGIDYFAVSLYDGPHQVEPLRAMFEAADVPATAYALRDRWQSEKENFGLSFLTNRAGTVTVGRQAEVDRSRPCHYPAYQLMIDWNGDALLCPQDWQKRVRFGNVASQSLMDVWTSPALHKRRMQLIRGERKTAPCSGCNANGCSHGKEHATAW